MVPVEVTYIVPPLLLVATGSVIVTLLNVILVEAQVAYMNPPFANAVVGLIVAVAGLVA